MLILVPLVLIFFCISYLIVNDNLTIFSQSIVYILIFIILFISGYTYKKIKANLKNQELNKIQISINQLLKKLENTTDDIQIKGIQQEISRLKKEYQQIQDNT